MRLPSTPAIIYSQRKDTLYPHISLYLRPANWLVVIDSELFTSITTATKYSMESYDYIGVDGDADDVDRVIHACDDCLVRLRGVIPD